MRGFPFVFLETISFSKLVNFSCSCKHVRVKEKLSWGLTMKIVYWSHLGCYFLATLPYYNSCRLSHLYLWLCIGFVSINDMITAMIHYRLFNVDRIIIRCIFLKLYVFQNLWPHLCLSFSLELFYKIFLKLLKTHNLCCPSGRMLEILLYLGHH